MSPAAVAARWRSQWRRKNAGGDDEVEVLEIVTL
jgi:hypothetical protein